MLSRIKAWCRHSLTIAWAYLVGLASALLSVVLLAAELLNSPELKAQVALALDPHTVAWIGLGVAVVTALARMRSLGKTD
jgi:hypothetical protein